MAPDLLIPSALRDLRDVPLADLPQRPVILAHALDRVVPGTVPVTVVVPVAAFQSALG